MPKTSSQLWSESSRSQRLLNRALHARVRVFADRQGRQDVGWAAAVPLQGLRGGLHLPHGTIFEHGKKDLATWALSLKLMTWNVPVEAAAELCGVAHQTAFEWRHRVFATVSGYQDRIVLRNRVWIDEVYVNDTDLSKGYGQARKRGLSKQKICIAIAIDASKNPVAVVCGHGKPSTKRIKAALGSHLAEGSTVVHDKERAHNGVIADRKCTSEAYKADVADPAYLDAMEMVNNLSSWLKRYLWRFTGMDPANLQSGSSACSTCTGQRTDGRKPQGWYAI